MAETVKGLKKLLQRIDEFNGELDSSIEKIVESNARDLEAKAKFKAPVDKGDLQQSIKALNDGRLTWKVMANATGEAPYAAHVEYGTAPHVILPKNAKALRFKVGGEFVFATKVNHPGTRPQPYLFPAFVEQRKDFIRYLKEYLKTKTKKI